MNDQEILEALCNLPVSAKTENKSIAQLVRESEIQSNPTALTVDRVRAYLSVNPERIEQWFFWSEDKRVSSGWFIEQRPGGYLVGFHPHGERLVFDDKVQACAEFIVREIQGIVSRLK